MTLVTREQRIKASIEDKKYFLEGLWDADPDEPFHKIFTRDTKRASKMCSATINQSLRNSPTERTIDLLMRF